MLAVLQEGIEAALKLSKKIRMRQDTTEVSRKLDAIDKQFTKDFVGKDLINMALQSVVYQIEEDAELKKSDKGVSHPKAIEDSLTLYREMKEATELNLRFLKLASRIVEKESANA
jgi:hypothetical protein